MILFPLADELLEHIDSRYSLAMLASKRANELDAGVVLLLEHYDSSESVGKVPEEILVGKVTIDLDHTEDSQDQTRLDK